MSDNYIKYPGFIATSLSPGAYPLLAPDGTAAAPSYSFSTDSDTGIYLSAANTLAFTTNGVLAASINSSGNLVVVGTAGASNLSGTNSGNVTLAAVGSSPNANAASLSTQALTLQPADGSNPGVITAGVQTIGGAKTFSSTIAASNLSGTNTGDQTITLTSDVTGTGTGSFVTTIAANAVTNAKAAQMATLTIKGNNTGSTANSLDLTVAQVNTMLGDVTTLAAVGAAPNANSASISGNTLTIQPASSSFPGVVTTGTQTMAGIKTFSTQLIGAGTATNDNAAAGVIGEVITASQGATSLSAASGDFENVTSISLTAGDWDVRGGVHCINNGSVETGRFGAISINSGNSTGDQTSGLNQFSSLPANASISTTIAIPNYRLSLSGTTTVYLKTRVDYSAGTPKYLGTITARRMR